MHPLSSYRVRHFRLGEVFLSLRARGLIFGANLWLKNTVCSREFIMDISERIELIERYFKNYRSVTLCLREHRAVHGKNSGPAETALRSLVNKFLPNLGKRPSSLCAGTTSSLTTNDCFVRFLVKIRDENIFIANLSMESDIDT